MPTRSTSRAAVAAAISVAAFLFVVPALALNIVGTNGNDVLRGTGRADRVNGRGGDDRILGLAGNDTLTGGLGRDYVDGGAGSDRLLLRDGARDTAVCGAGRDSVTADQSDVVRANCETVLRPTPPTPPTPPPLPPLATVGHYASTDGAFALDVPDGGRSVTNVSFRGLWPCSGGSLASVSVPVSLAGPFPILEDKTFSIDTQIPDGFKPTVSVRATFTGPNAVSGTVTLRVSVLGSECGGTVTWAATRSG